ncbi:hypothetical protein JCM3766R1_006987 [Sporobolomyces carnicolor]
MSSYAPEPSPAPTLAGVPGYYFPETPDSTTHDDPLDRQTSTAAPATESRPSPDADPNDEYAHKVNNAVGVGIASLGGLVVGGPVGAVIAGGIVGLVESENDGLRAHANEVEPNSATSKDAPEDKAFEVQGENAQHALEESPAQKLVNPDDADEGSKLTGAGALGGALLAGGAGAKVAENEVSEPSEDNSLTPTATHQALPEQAAAPDFGTPAIEKEQAELAHSPAQRMLGERSESTVGAENVLLAGGTGAVIASREIEEPESTSAPEGATAPTTTAGAGTTSEPLERQVSSVPNPAPETPRPVATTQPSTSSFTAAVLAAGTGIDTPTREDVPLSMKGSTGVHPLVQATDQPLSDTASVKTATPDTAQSSVQNTPCTHPNILPVVFPSQYKEPTVSDREVAAETSPAAVVPASEQPVDEVVHNPPPQTLDALTSVNSIPESGAAAPQDFRPYETPAIDGEGEQSTPRDKGKGKEKEIEAAAAGLGAGAGAAAIAHELREKRSIDSSDGRPSSHPGSVFREDFTPQPQAVEYNPLAIENQRAIPPQQAQGDPVLVMPAVDKGKGRAIDPEELHKVPSTTSEQAGFARGAPATVATQEFAHLSQPDPQAETLAQKDAPRGTDTEDAVPAGTDSTDRSAVPLVVPAVAGFAAGSATSHAVNNNATSAHLSEAPANSAILAQQPVPVAQQQAPVAQQQQPVPLNQQAQPSRINATAVPVQPEAQAQPQAQFQPQTQPQPQSRIVSPAQQQQVTPQRTTSPHGLAEGVERSPHMRIQTHADESGHKKLHRKSLAADTVPLKFGIGKTKASKPDKSIENEARRDRLMDGWSGVPDPTLQQTQPVPVQHQQQQPVVHQQPAVRQPQQQQQPAVHYQQPAVAGQDYAAVNRGPGVAHQGQAVPAAPVGSGSQFAAQQAPARTSAPSSPTSPAGQSNETVHRKLSKSRPRRKSNASASSDKGGFLGKVFGRHSRSTSGSVDGGSNRASAELQRPAA